MSMTKSDLQHIGRWLQKLRRSTAAGKDDVTAEQLADYTGWLAQDFPLSLFTDASAKAIAEANEYFPKWAILRAHMAEWHDRHPAQPRLAVDIPNSLQERIDELNDSGAYFRRVAEERAQAREDWSDPAKIRASLQKIPDDHPRQGEMRRFLSGLIKRHAPENVDYLPPECQT